MNHALLRFLLPYGKTNALKPQKASISFFSHPPSFNRSKETKAHACSAQRHFINIIDIKGMHFDNLSLMNALLLREQTTLKKLYQRNTSSPTVRLVHALFHQLGNQFQHTQSKSNVAFSLSPTLIAKIRHHLLAQTLTTPKIKKELASEWQKEHQLKTGNLNQIKIDAFFDLLLQSHEECKHNPAYPADLIEHILGAFLLYKATTRCELMEFINTAHQLDPLVHAKLSLNLKDAFDKRDLSVGDNALKDLCDEDHANNHLNIIKNHYEQISASLLLQNAPLAEVKRANYGYKEQAPVANCMEAALHNLINIILYDGQKFSVSCLPESLNPHETLHSFYEQQNWDSAHVNEPSVGQAFMDLVSGHSFLDYNHTKNQHPYELMPNSNQVIPLLNHLLGSNAGSWSELSDQLSTKSRQIQFTQDKDDVCIQWQVKDKEVIHMKLAILPRHAELKADDLYNHRTHDTSYQHAKIQFHEHPLLSALLYQTSPSSTRMLDSKRPLTLKELNTLLLYLAQKREHIYDMLSIAEPYIAQWPDLTLTLQTCIKECGHDLQSFIKNCIYFHSSEKIHMLLKTHLLQPDYITENKEPLLFHLIKQEADSSLIETLFHLGVSPDTSTSDGTTALMCATQSRISNRLVKLLCEQNAKLNVQDDQGNTALIRATRSKYGHHMTRLLLEFGANPDLQNKQGDTALIMAIDKECDPQMTHQIARILLIHGANPNLQNKQGKTALIIATEQERSDLIQTLLYDYKADADLQDNNGNTAWMIAAKKNRKDHFNEPFRFYEQEKKATQLREEQELIFIEHALKMG